MENQKEYKIVINLIDDTQIIEYTDYYFAVNDSKLNDMREDFMVIGNSSINKKHIKFIQILKNENYVKKEEE